MIPLVHFFASLVFSAVLFPFFGWFSVLFFVGSFFVDVDHYLDYVFSFRDFSLKRAYLFYKNYSGHLTVRLNVFHTFEFWVFLLVLSFFYDVVMFFSLGVLFHMLLDLHNLALKKNITRSPSIIHWFVRKR